MTRQFTVEERLYKRAVTLAIRSTGRPAAKRRLAQTWLEMDFVPDDLNQTEMHSFEKQIAQWIRL